MENIIYNQDGWIIVDVQSKEDIERYGPEDIQTELIQDWARLFRDGDFYIIINGNDRWFMFKDKDRNIKYYNRDFDDIDKNEFKTELEYNEFTGFQFIQDNIIKYGKLLELLLKIARSEEIDRYDYSDYDELIYDIIIKPDKPFFSTVIIHFEDEDKFMDMFDIDPDDRWFINSLRSYEGHEFIDDYTAKNDWNEGYILRYINDENRRKLNKLVNIIDPTINLEDDVMVSDCLMKNFEDEVETIYYDYAYHLDQAGNEYGNRLIEEDFGNPFFMRGIFGLSPMYKYSTTVNTLLRLILEYFNDRTLTIFDIMANFAKDTGYRMSSENQYDYPYQGDFNDDGFNNTVDSSIDDMYEKLEEDYSDFNEFQLTYDYITSKYKIGNYNLYPLDRDKTEKRTFVIDGVDKKTNKIIVSLYNSDGSKKDTRSLTIDEFNRFLTQYELFEGIKRYHTKIINEQLNNDRNKILVKQFMDTLKPTSKKEPIGNLNKMINDYNNQNPKLPKLNLETVLNTPTDSKLKIDLDGIPTLPNGIQKVITNAELELKPNFTITLQKNPISGKTLPGVKINF